MSDTIIKTVILEDNDDYTRVKTQCNDQNYVREYYMGQLNVGAAISALSYLTDMITDISLINLNILEGQANLTDNQKVNFEKLKHYHSLLKSTSLQDDNWQLDWVYLDVKHQQDILSLQFFEKRKELQLGESLPDPIPNPVPDINTILGQ